MFLWRLIMTALKRVWFKVFKVDFYESIIDYAVMNASRGIIEDELLSFLSVRGFTLSKDGANDAYVTYQELFNALWNKNGEKYYVNTQMLNEIMLLKSIKQERFVSHIALFISLFSVISICSLGYFLMMQNTKSHYSYFLEKQTELLREINTNLEHLRFHRITE